MKPDKKNEFEKLNNQAESGLIAEFYALLKHNKKFWLLPLIVGLLVLGMIIVLGGTAAAPFIYTLF